MGKDDSLNNIFGLKMSVDKNAQAFALFYDKKNDTIKFGLKEKQPKPQVKK